MKRILKATLISIVILLAMSLVSLMFSFLGDNARDLLGCIAISYMAISIYERLKDE